MFVIGNISSQESNSKVIKRKEEDFEASERLTEVAAKRVRKGEVRISLDLDHIEKLIDQIDRLEDFPSEDLPEVLDLIEAYRSDPDKSPFFLPKDSSVSLGEIELTFPFSLGLRPVEKKEGRSGIVVLFEPSCKKLEENEEAIDWSPAFEMFIPDQLFPDEKLPLDQVRIAYEKEEMRKETKKELRMRSRVEQIPGGGELFQPAPYLYSKKPFIFTSPLSGEALSSKKILYLLSMV